MTLKNFKLTTKTPMSWIKTISLNCLILVFALEGGAFLLTKFKLIPIVDEPTYSLGNKNGKSTGYWGHDWRNEKESWGAWHKSNSRDRHKTACFDVEYQSNDVGARDDVNYQTQISPNSIALIGDSFAEGHGVNLEDTFAKKLSKDINKQVLNFGAAENGPVQEFLIYQELVSKIPHSEVIYFFFPRNDFADNSFLFEGWFGNRYRPFFRPIGEEQYEIYYPPTAKKSEDYPSNKRVKHSSFRDQFKVDLVNFTYFSNVLKSFTYALKDKQVNKHNLDNAKDKPVVPSDARGYFASESESIKGALYYVDKLFQEIPPDFPITIIVIPSKWDIEDILELGWGYLQLDWYLGLKNIADKFDAKFIDLALSPDGGQNSSRLRAGLNQWYHSCDLHWNAAGNEMAVQQFKHHWNMD